MKKSAANIKRALRELRRDVIESTNDPYERRIAYAMESAIRWATENTVGWERPAKEARILAAMLRKDVCQMSQAQCVR